MIKSQPIIFLLFSLFLGIQSAMCTLPGDDAEEHAPPSVQFSTSKTQDDSPGLCSCETFIYLGVSIPAVTMVGITAFKVFQFAAYSMAWEYLEKNNILDNVR